MAAPGPRVGVPGGLEDLGTIDWGGNEVPQQPATTTDMRQQQQQLIRGEISARHWHHSPGVVKIHLC